VLKIPAVRKALGIPSHTAAQPRLTSTTISPFQAAVTQAKQGAVIKTYATKPSKKTKK